LLALVPLATGCGTYQWAREVRRIPGGGEVALQDETSPASQSVARRIMAARCPNGYTIVEEGDVVISIHRNAEWHVRYLCNGSAAQRATQ
jgi:hypothetical protein